MNVLSWLLGSSVLAGVAVGVADGARSGIALAVALTGVSARREARSLQAIVAVASVLHAVLIDTAGASTRVSRRAEVGDAVSADGVRAVIVVGAGGAASVGVGLADVSLADVASVNDAAVRVNVAVLSALVAVDADTLR